MLDEADKVIIIDVLRMSVKRAKKCNEKIKAAGWTGTGAVGYHILRLNGIIKKLGGRIPPGS